MSGEIKLNDDDLDTTIHLISGCEQSIAPASGTALPGLSSDSPAMTALMSRMFELGALVDEYKRVLRGDLSALEAAKATLQGADSAAAASMEG